jgi:hypothetical protein
MLSNESGIKQAKELADTAMASVRSLSSCYILHY